MQKVGLAIDVGSQLVFTRYMDEQFMPVSERIFTPGQFLVVGAINEDGGLQCYPTDDAGKLVSPEGDTIFPEEAVHLGYAPKLDVKTLF